jgi:hypothetical protein
MDFSGRGSIGNKLNRPDDETSFTISPTYILTNSHDCLLREWYSTVISTTPTVIHFNENCIFKNVVCDTLRKVGSALPGSYLNICNVDIQLRRIIRNSDIEESSQSCQSEMKTREIASVQGFIFPPSDQLPAVKT